MTSNLQTPHPPDLDGYLRLFAPYEGQLRDFAASGEPFGNRFALLFRQVLRLLIRPSELNQRMPEPFIEVARRYLRGDHATVRHFSYEENRHFFLSDLYDWLQIQGRGRRMREMGR